MNNQTRERMVRLIGEVVAERERQDDLWGEQNHPAGDWLLILMEEVGEWSQAMLDVRFKGLSPTLVREELVQVVAVALAMLESNDRNNGEPATS